MKQMQVSVTLKMPSPERSAYHEKQSMNDKVDECLLMIESQHDSRHHWEYIQRINDILMKKPSLTKAQACLLKKIQPVIKKYGPMEGALQDTERLSAIGALV